MKALAFLLAGSIATLSPRHAEAQFLTKVGSFLVQTTGPNQTISGVGFTPRAVIFFWTAQTAGGFANNASAGYGFATGVGSQRAVSFVSDNNLDATNPGRWQWTTCIAVLASAAAAGTDAEASLTGMTADGFTLNWSVRNTAYIIHYLALGGPDITNAFVGSFTPTAGTGSQSIAGVGFQPQFLMFLSIDSNTVGSKVTPDGKVSLGYAGLSGTYGITQGANTAVSRTTAAAANIITNGIQRTNAAILEKDPGSGGGSLEFEAAVTSFDANGFTIDKVVNVGGTETTVHYLALRGGQYRVGEIRRPLTAGAQTVAYTGVGFTPHGLLFQSYNLTDQLPPDEEARISFSAADNRFSGIPFRANQRATFFHDKIDAPSDSDRSWVRQATSGSAGVNGKLVYLAQAGDCPLRWPEGGPDLICSAGPRLISDADLASHDRNGFTLDWTTNDLANMNQTAGDEENAQVLYVAFGPPPVQTNYRSIGSAGNVGGTLSATLGSPLVSDATATWRTANRGRGDLITIGGTPYVVQVVNSETQLALTTPFAAATGPYAYTIARQFTALGAWEDCIDGLANGGSCPAFAPASNDLRADHRREVGIAYKDSSFALSGDVTVNGSVTDASHTITLTADPGNRHLGVAGAGVVVDGQSSPLEILVSDPYVTVEWLEIIRVRGADATGSVRVLDAGMGVLLQNLLIHDFWDPTIGNNVSGIRLSGAGNQWLTIRNTMIWDGDYFGIEADMVTDQVTVQNCSVDNIRDAGGRGLDPTASLMTVRNTIATRNPGGDFAGTGYSASSSNNISSDGTAPGADPLTVLPANVDALFVTPGSDLHLEAGAVAIDSGVSLVGFTHDIDWGIRPAGAGWDRGADEFGATTAVELASFSAAAADAAVELQWETSSELSNLGFHLYRAASASGPYTRITSSLVPGLGSSPVGARYAYLDTGLVNGVTYFYELEDVEATGRTKRHGPVSATPRPGATPPGPEAPGPEAPGPAPSVLAYGDPTQVSLRVLERGPDTVVLELLTGGFYAQRLPDGTVRLSVPGFEALSDPGHPLLPVERTMVGARAGFGVRIASIQALDVAGFASLRPEAAGRPELAAGRDGTLRAGQRRVARSVGRGVYPDPAARLLSVGFQGEAKKALVELAPLRFDPASGRLLLARRLRVTLAFTGGEPGERRLGGGRGRFYRPRPGPAGAGRVVARLVARHSGVYAVAFESAFPSQRRAVPALGLRLARRGRNVAYHLEPDPSRFGPGSMLYFLSEGGSSSDYANEAVYELSLGAAGTPMPVVSAPPEGAALSHAVGRQGWERNRAYLAGLLEAPDLWLWDSLLSGARKSYELGLSGLAASSEPATLRVWLQGASDLDGSPDHHVRVHLNGSLVVEASWDGKTARRLEGPVLPGVLQEGPNVLEVENVGDAPAVQSMVFLDRVSLEYPRTLAAEAGRFEGRFGFGGTATVAGLDARSVVLDTTEAPASDGISPRWIGGAAAGPAGLTLRAEAGRRYLAVSPGALLAPEVRWPMPSDLMSTRNQADYLLLAPRELLPAAAPLVELRKGQGLTARAVALEEVFELFGHGERSPQAIRDFLAYAYHRWSAPSPRYALLLGDATFDPKDYGGTGVKDLLPALMIRSTYLWTVSDQAFAAVNGEDDMPDLAVGRLPAASLEQARSLIEKVLAFEEAGPDLSGPAVLVADNADLGGDFEANAEEIASSLLAGRDTEKVYLGRLGASAARAEILAAFDRGASLVSYVGHGGTAVWASENVFNSWDMVKLGPQARQPLVFTMNCLNGYFLPPAFDALGEALVKAEGKGAIAAVSPSGLSLDGPAHLYHRALLAQVVSGQHARLGDAILAAQGEYAATGVFPELLRVYNLLGDPALSLR